MPEGVEIELYRRQALAGLDREITAVDADDEWFLKGDTTPEALGAALVGERFTAAERIGKLLLMEVSSGSVLGLRFGMTGRLLVDGTADIDYLEYSSRRNDPVWDRFAVHFGDGGSMVVRDPRRLGGVELDPDVTKLGPDVFTVTREQLLHRVLVGDVALKARLLDQGRLAGVGNLIADEVCWRAGIDPARAAGSLDDRQVDRLVASLRDVLADFVADGGSHTGRLQPARQRGSMCPADGEPLQRRTVGGRTTYSCPQHQR